MTAHRVAWSIFGIAVAAACSQTLAGSTPDASSTDASPSADAPVDVEEPTTVPWSADFAELESLAGRSMGDCDGSSQSGWRVQHDMVWLGRACRLDDIAGPELKLGTSLYSPDVNFHGGWLVMELKTYDDDTFGFHYGGTHFTYYRVTMALKDLNARFNVVAMPPYGVDGTVQVGGEAALRPTFKNIGETLYVFPPYDTWFELALHWDGRRHQLYVDRVLVAEAELPSDMNVLPGGPVALHQHDQVAMNIRSMAIHPPGTPPWEAEVLR